MKKFLLGCIVFAGLVTGCGKNIHSDEQQTENDKAFNITLSNLAGETTLNEVKNNLINAGINPDSVSRFIENVKIYNETVGTKYLIDDYVSKDVNELYYDLEPMINNWNNLNPDYIGHNCRITTMGLVEDLITVENITEKDSEFLIGEKDVFSKSDNNITDKNKFFNFYDLILTENTKDINVHVTNVKKFLTENGIKFFESDKFSIISVYFHDDSDENVGKLFIGHTGILLKNDENYLFIEKVSFEEPYQAIKFNNKQELNDYLMFKYDVSWGQKFADPFIFENDDLLDEYRPNPYKKTGN